MKKNKEFSFHILNETGKAKATAITAAFDLLLNTLTGEDPSVTTAALCPAGRELALVRTKLEEASFFAKKAMASAPENGEVQS